jgi:hypothetical protein
MDLEPGEHIEICSKCQKRYLEVLPKTKGPQPVYMCDKCFLITVVIASLINVVDQLREKIKELEAGV